MRYQKETVADELVPSLSAERVILVRVVWVHTEVSSCSEGFVFGTDGRIRQSSQKIDFGGYELETGF